MRLHLEARKLKRRRARGQSLVLACLSFLLLALMTIMSFNLSHALREKVNLQQHSDSMAYSMAVMEARALNYYAASNRAIAASYVAMTSMHAYMSTASLTREMLKASQTNFYIIAAEEFAQCACWTCFMHCVHGIKAIQIASKYSNKANNYANKVKDLDEDFNKVMGSLDTMVDTIHLSQTAVHAKTVLMVQDGSSNGLSELTDYNAPGASNIASAVGALNMNEFNCAVDGMVCMGGESNSSKEAASKAMTQIANASRPVWPSTRATGLLEKTMPLPFLHPSFIQEMMNDIPGEGVHSPIPFLSKGGSSLGQGAGDYATPGQVARQGKVVTSQEKNGAMANQWKHGIGPYMPFSASIMSNENNGSHSPSAAHKGNHKFEGVSAKDFMGCIMAGNCFMKFRGSSDAKKDYGQPRSYSYVTKQFRVGDAQKADWELNSSASITFKNGPQSGKLTLAADEGAGLSKAIVYYHRFGENGWREAPTLFNPYWRAKLHPFNAQEAAKVLGMAGNTDAAQIAATPGVSL